MKENFVTIRHPELGVESSIHRESIPVWLENGWQLVGEYPGLPGDDEQVMFEFSEETEPSADSEEE